MVKINQKITTFLWFDTQAEAAARFYASLFKDSRIVAISRYPDAVSDKAGSVMLVTFELAGQQFRALNAGPQYKFNESISLLVECETQAEIDEFWSKLTEGGKEQPCGWLTDRFGLSWQIAPARLLELVSGDDREAASAAMRAMFEMKKIIIADIERAVKARQ
ncbi:3-demethylubiquinone-9 3-methyltransferase [Bradyrhizobium sp. LTSPM299]|jgi:predicted 3-demethylubiquinone-9 3-methyltransferase (glyoxalase superfamily)|uniref:VOC family protein n=1 Tax=Bradyrhizobium sp. LTSPM299 TaxID=1619233 RepID=UPI0005C8FEC3|nr:VOC family protein [Bradyrhizobium sp. LTSPM299]KJC58121.1 3-demethylubiquinone-9 3-methyltransferase [Bradyrhizobium sp. LTSPM299]